MATVQPAAGRARSDVIGCKRGLHVEEATQSRRPLQPGPRAAKGIL